VYASKVEKRELSRIRKEGEVNIISKFCILD
jgi:hypothetical protein